MEKIKKIKIIHAPIHFVHLKAIDCLHFLKYLRADNIRWVMNNRNSNQRYLIYRYSGTQGLMAQVMGVLCWINYAEKNKYTLIVDMTQDNDIYRESEDENVWEKFFEQPMLNHPASREWIKVVEEHENFAICPLADRAGLLWDPAFRHFQQWIKPTINHPSTRDYKENPKIQKRYEYLFHKYIRPVESVQRYIENEYKTIFKPKIKDGNRFLGVLVRGTDYTGTKPYMHPVQPNVELVLSKVKELKQSFNWDNIYLATDESNIEKMFRDEFPNSIITNTRKYYETSDYYNQPVRKIHHNRERDNYLRGLEYLSSMYLLSKCDMLVGGLCGGSQAALLMNNDEYDLYYLFDLGNYGVDD